jgi:hypothetical protein
MSFNRRGPYDRRPDRPDRRGPPDRGGGPPRQGGQGGGGDWQRDRPRGDRPPYPSRGPRYDRGPADEGGMSIRLDPRRLGTLKQLAAEADMRPGDLVRTWVEERIDAARGGARPAAGPDRVLGLIAAIEARLAALEAASGTTAPQPAEPGAEVARPSPEARAETPAAVPPESEQKAEKPVKRGRVSAAPSDEKVALHDEMIAVIRERGPLSAAELAAAVVERGRYAPPRSKKPLDAAMVSQRVSNPTYRKLFTRTGGRIGLAE